MEEPIKYRLYTLPMLQPTVMLALGISMAKILTPLCHPIAWIAAITILLAASILSKTVNSKTFFIFLACFALGAQRMSYELSPTKSATQARTYETLDASQLSIWDKAKEKAKSLRHEMEQDLKRQGLEGQHHAIISAMLLGDKSTIDTNTRQTYSASGASHVLAVSGLHIGIIFGLLTIGLGGIWQNGRRKLSLTIALTCIWAYIFTIGMPTSGIRAATMISIYTCAKLSNRRTPSLQILLVAVFWMLAASPSYLFDIGFQMSFLAVLFIILLQPHIQGLITPKRGKWLWSMVALSIAAQIGTIPVVAHYFGYISCYSVLSSLIAIPAATASLYMGIIVITCSYIGWNWLNILSSWIVQALNITLDLTNTALEFIAELPGAQIDHVKINIPQLLLIYGAIAAGCLIIHKLRLFHSHRSHLVSSDTDYNLLADRT